LIQFYRLDVETPVDVLESDPEDSRIPDVIPLVVNTMGWNKGLGADLAVRIEEIAEPTDVFEIQSPVKDQSWPASHTPPFRLQDGEIPQQNGCGRLHSLKPVSISVQTVNFSPTDFRNLAILSYFHAIFPFDKSADLRQISAVSWNTAIPLCSHPPYEVDWATAVEKVILVGAGMEDVVPSEIERVLNGALVGLVNCEPGTLDEDMSIQVEQGQARTQSAQCRIPYTQAMSPPSPLTSVCSGLALVRAISPTSFHMHIVAPLPPHLFSNSRVLVKGELELPIWGLLDFRNETQDAGGVDLEKAPFLRWGKKGGIGTERRRVRRNLMRKGQM
jgi:polynucleotide 5'-hydroxyl-kinase GRC3/NOL9